MHWNCDQYISTELNRRVNREICFATAQLPALPALTGGSWDPLSFIFRCMAMTATWGGRRQKESSLNDGLPSADTIFHFCFMASGLCLPASPIPHSFWRQRLNTLGCCVFYTLHKRETKAQVYQLLCSLEQRSTVEQELWWARCALMPMMRSLAVNKPRKFRQAQQGGTRSSGLPSSGLPYL